MKVSGKTKVCALLGDPAEHSLSPCFQNAAFQHLSLDFIYLAFTVKAENLRDAILGVRSLGFHGLNVTMPHKISVIQYLDELDEDAEKIKSVNTILNRNGKLIGYTTDGIGALNALKYNDVNSKGMKIVILGAGGASRSVSFALAREAKELVILNRTVEKAEKLVSDVRRLIGRCEKIRWGGLTEENIRKELREADILVNATPVGMSPNVDETPVDKSYLHPDLAVFDLVYHPLETRLLREARMVGAKTINGLSMLIHQGAASFEIWTEVKAPIEVMMKAAEEELKRRT
ncbi:TPA: shikimate dehydrogenase [Candidatus Bathyarchaeota archaeon]|nr:shikimate dehydrogenase [Candidatus Bathyarchaeota archaeon]